MKKPTTPESMAGPHKPKSSKPTSKIAKILSQLAQGYTFNRFDAEPYGDHCLHSTVSTLRNTYGLAIESRWERVPNNHSDTLTSVKRYWLPITERLKAERLLRCWGVTL